MLEISEADIRRRIERDNPWWVDPRVEIREGALPRRVYFGSFKSLSLNFDVRRATVLLGPRRVGKTVMLRQVIHDAIRSGINPQAILYASIDAPVYSRMPLEKFLRFLPSPITGQRSIVIFDEIQYLPGWEIHLKDLVDNYPEIKFVASGSAAAALKLKSKESGAGRFSEFMLPPLTFYEFLCFTGNDERLIKLDAPNYAPTNIEELNEKFIDYLNYGGYPEAVLNPEIRANAEQFIRNDIIDKVLLKDLPSLYGINEIPELNKLFAVLAYNAGNEVSLDGIAKTSGISKPTIKRYIEYLESAFLIMKLTTVDDNCRTLKRERNFKVYLNNPSMRAALFVPVSADEPDKVGHLAECAVFAQWQHSSASRQLRYARWKGGGVDVVYLGPDQKPHWVGEIKWSDRLEQKFGEELAPMQSFLESHPSIRVALFTTKTINRMNVLAGRPLQIQPTALYCYMVGRNITAQLDKMVEQVTAKAA